MIRWRLKTAKQARELDRLAAERLQQLLEQKPETDSHGPNGFDGALRGVHPPSPSPAAFSVDVPPNDMTELADEMAARFFGFGNWAAPYWFIGQEPGTSPGEDADNSRIVQAWAHQLGKRDLVDCREYHRAIRVSAWHGERARLQTTWRPLMLFLMTALKRETDREALRAYQRTRWGQIENGETCVIDLSVIPGKKLSEKTDGKEYLEQRIWTIRRRLMLGGHPPKMVLMHGLAARPEWEEIAGVPLEPDTVVKVGSTLFVMAPSPTAYRRKNADWEMLGLQMREHLNSK